MADPTNLDAARAALTRRYPNIAPDDDPTCADCFTSVHVRDGCEWTNGEDVCDACASRRLERTEAGLRAALAKVDRLTAERDEARADAAELRGGAVGSVHKLRARLAEVEAERDEARRILGELCAESGADTDGADWRHNWRYAAQEVRETWTDLRQDVVDLAAERDATIARADRAERELRCERGEWAPDGWTYSFSQGQWMHIADPFAKVWRNGWMRRPNGSGYVAWGWEVWLEGERVEGYAPTALDAIEAASTALREVAGG